ncbi:MAG TPA: NADH-quinone oxidoreductase subunit N [Pirellulales bacterium]|nr:NADH-quinone oxidoreductase subunit N [Pirellulales bacterium]
MSFYELIDGLLPGAKASCAGFAPELTLCATIVLMLLARLPGWGHKLNAFYIALPGALVALYYAAPWRLLNELRVVESGSFDPELFSGLLVYDELTVFFRGVLLVFAALFLVLTRLSGIPDREDSPDFYTLILGGTLGMCIMASANHLLMVFLGVEMASVPSYALAGMLKGRRQSSEAALKYAIFGAGASGVMLYGISLLAGALGSCHLPTMAAQLASLSPELFAERQTVLMLGGLMTAVGLAFKLSAFPFHFWCPDVFEGASAEVNAFLSVASKAAALALLIRVALGFSHVPASYLETAEATETAAVAAPETAKFHTVAYRAAEEAAEAEPEAADAEKHAAKDREEEPLVNAQAASLAALAPARRYIVGLVTLIAALTCTFGNLTAYAQTNIKRLLAYSTIAHAGYMMMPVAAAVAMLGDRPVEAQKAIASLAFYVGIYLFMNLGAFAIVAFLRNTIRSEEIADYAGLIRRCPGVAICFATILISLIGLPPLAGFAAKFAVFVYLVAAQQYLLLAIAGANTAISLFYYLRVVKAMTIDPEPKDCLPARLPLVSPAGVYIVLITLPVVVLGVYFDDLNRWAQAAAQHLLS